MEEAGDSSHGLTGASILSEKVQRALEVRTDTPAMKAALDALAHLPSSGDMDSRSVRVAIEQDALQQALLLQQELKTLLDVVSELRQGVSDTAAIAKQVHLAINTNVMSPSAATPNLDLGGSQEEDLRDEETQSETLQQQQQKQQQLSPEEALEQEQHLAALLADAFRERNEAAQRAETVQSFLEKFDLSEEHSHLLDNYDFGDIHLSDYEGMQFLEALERVRAIRQQLTSTLGPTTSTSSTLASDSLFPEVHTKDAKRLGATSAIRMMESLAQKQERAYERLYHWLQSYLHLTSSSVAPHVPTSSSDSKNMTMVDQQQQLDVDAMDDALSHALVRRGLRVLRHVPAFYAHTLEMIAASRRSEGTRRFLLALTSGYAGRPPIELRAHDPVNYVGDMLAFAFQSCSVEADVAKGLVKAGEEEEVAMDAERGEEAVLMEDDLALTEPQPAMTAADMLAHAMSGIARPLKSRILQVVASLSRKSEEEDDDGAHGALEDEEEGAAARSQVSSLYSICGLLLFYRSALDKAVHKLARETNQQVPDNPLVSAISDCLKEASEAYAASLRVYAAMLETVTVMTGEPEASLVQAMVTQISHVRAESPGFSTDVECPSELQKSLSLEFMAETLLEAALLSCKSLDHSVTLKLSLATAKKAGLSTTVASQLDALISHKEQGMIDGLVQEETSHVLELCGLGTMATAFRGMLPVEGMTMAAHAGLTRDEVETSMKEFYSSLYSPPLPSFEYIKDPVLRKLARNKIADNVVRTYEELYHAMHSDKGGYDDLSFLGHTPEQVKTLFSV